MVGLRDEVAVDGGLEIDHSSEDTALQSLLGKVGEEPLDCVEPRARGRCRCRGSRAQTFWPAPAQEADELLVTMALHTSANDLAFEHVASSEQRRCSLALDRENQFWIERLQHAEVKWTRSTNPIQARGT